MNSRRVELWGEGFRFYDLKRLHLSIKRGSNFDIAFCTFLEKDKDAVSNPDIRIFSANDWHNEWRNNGLWGNSDGLTKNVKTVYDPCPEGYCVPDQNCYQGFTFYFKNGM